MSKVSNAITMLELLSSGRKYSIKELADNLEVTERMIRKYKDDLEKAGIYIDTIMGPYGGYVLNDSIKIPARKFDENDVELLNKYIDSEKSSSNREKLIVLQDKIKGIYFNNQNEKSVLNDDQQEKYNIISKSIKEKRKVKILYYSYDSGDNERIIRPAELFLFNNEWCTSAYCELRRDLRHFELKRIKKIELLDEKF